MQPAKPSRPPPVPFAEQLHQRRDEQVVMAPIYLQALFLNQPMDPDHARMLVDRLLAVV